MNQSINHIAPHIFTTDELYSSGISHRQLRKKVQNQEFVRMRRGIYINGSIWAELKPWDQQLAKILALHHKFPQILFSHTSAALLHGMPVPLHPLIHIYFLGNNHAKMTGVIKHTTGASLPQTYLKSGIRVTQLLQTVQDCVRILNPPEALALADSALRQEMMPPQILSQHLRDMRGAGAQVARRIAPLISIHAESAGESFTRFMLHEMKLDFVEQEEIVVNQRLYRVDFKLVGLPVIVEFDGRVKLTDFGATDAVIEKERFREKDLQNSGWFVFRVTWDDVVRHPAHTKFRLKQLINSVRNGNR